jgi:hypothetical protein
LFAPRIQRAGHRLDQAFPAGMFGKQLLLAGMCEAVGLGPLAILRDLPFRGDPAFAFQPVQRGVERTCIDLQDIAGISANRLADRIAMLWPSL